MSSDSTAAGSVALWTIYHYSPDYEIYESEAAAASAAVTMNIDNMGGYGVVLGVQYEDGRAVDRDGWAAYREEAERREAEPPPLSPPAPAPRRKRRIKDPFRNFSMDIEAEEPSWIGNPG